MTTPTQTVNHLEGFKTFVAAQDPEQPINHYDGYESCAVGAYGASINLNNPDGFVLIMDDIGNQLSVHQPKLHSSNGLMVDVLNIPTIADAIIPTYGKLSEWLETPDNPKALEAIDDYNNA
ncbi:hypothetical protein D3C76_165750 [compost metagenome]